jgi:hypothetical protein
MDQKNETVSNECSPQPQSSPKPTLEQVQAELVRAEQQLASADLIYTHAHAVMGAAEESEYQARYAVLTAEGWRNRCREALTKAVRASVIVLCLLLPHFAHAQTITIPVTVPPPTPLTVTIPPGTTVVSGGLIYNVAGTLTLTLSSTAPIVTPTPVPTPVPTTGLTFTGYRDHNRNPATTAAAGDTLFIGGSGFSAAGASVTFNGIVARIAAQTDKEIAVTVPNVPGVAVIVVNGVTDPFPLTVTPQSAVLPGTAPGDLAPYDWPPFVVDFHDALGQHIEKAVLGETITLVGNTFGDLGGRVWLGNEVVPTISWTDQEIRLLLDPLLLAPAPNGSTWVVQREGNARGVTWGPVITAKIAG